MNGTLVLLGAGTLARMLYWCAQECFPGIEVVFVDDVSPVRTLELGGRTVPVVKDWNFAPVRGAGAAGRFSQFVVAAAEPKVKEILVGKALAAGLAPAPSLIHPRACVQGLDCAVGRGGALQPNCLITTNTRLGDYVHLVGNCAIGNDCVVGDFCTLYPGCVVSGGVTMGAGVLLGTGTVVNDDVSIAPGVSTGSQTCIIKTIDEANIQLVGVPARKIVRGGG